jgi:hypothetical protein
VTARFTPRAPFRIADSARKVISYPWCQAHADLPVLSCPQRRRQGLAAGPRGRGGNWPAPAFRSWLLRVFGHFVCLIGESLPPLGLGALAGLAWRSDKVSRLFQLPRGNASTVYSCDVLLCGFVPQFSGLPDRMPR